MRTWIIVGCLCVCHALAPEQDVALSFGIPLVALILVGMGADLVEFIERND